MSDRSREDLPDVQEWSGDPQRFAGVVRRLSRIYGSGRETFPDLREWSRGPP